MPLALGRGHYQVTLSQEVKMKLLQRLRALSERLYAEYNLEQSKLQSEKELIELIEQDINHGSFFTLAYHQNDYFKLTGHYYKFPPEQIKDKKEPEIPNNIDLSNN